MILRVLTWLLAVGVCFAALGLDGAPSDPRRSAPSQPPGTSAVLVVSRPRPELYGFLGQDGPAYWALWPQLPGELGIYVDAPQQTRGYAQLLDTLALAEDRALAEPVEIPGLFNVQGASPQAVRVYPASDIQAALPNFDLQEPLVLSEGSVDIGWISGGALAVGTPDALSKVAEFWPAYQRAMGCLPAADAPPADPNAHVLEVHSTRAFHPADGQPSETSDIDIILQACIHQALGITPRQRIPGGLLVQAPAWQQAMIRQTLADPGWLRLAAELQFSAPRRARALREALEDDDPHLAEFAVLVLLMDRQKSPTRLPIETLQSLPHHAQINDPLHMFWQADLILEILDQASPAVAARALARLGRTTVDPDRICGPIAEALGHKAPEVRAAAQGVALDRLLRGLLLRRSFRHSRGVWPADERAAYFDELPDRLRAELASGEAERAVDVVCEALALCDFDSLDQARASPAAISRLLELGAMLVLDPVHGARFCDSKRDAAIMAAEECLRHSDPEVRRAAWRLISQHRPAVLESLKSCQGDPYLADLLESPRQRHAGRE